MFLNFRPTNFHPDKYLESVLDGTCLDSQKVLATMSQCEEGRGGLLLDSAGLVMARAEPDTSHPLHHTAMILIDRVAALQGGGAFLQPADSSSLSPGGHSPSI